MEWYLDLIKAENPAAYKALAEKGIMVGFPAKVMGQEKRPDIGMHYHSTVKFFDPDKDQPSDIHNVASKLQLTPPDPKKTRIEPSMFKDRVGNDVYVVKLHGPHADEIKSHNKAFSHMGYPTTFEYTPHVSVDKATWQKIVDSKATTAHEAGIEFGPAQLRQGHNVLATYPHAPRKQDRLAASEESVGVPLKKVFQAADPKKPGVSEVGASVRALNELRDPKKRTEAAKRVKSDMKHVRKPPEAVLSGWEKLTREQIKQGHKESLGRTAHAHRDKTPGPKTGESETPTVKIARPKEEKLAASEAAYEDSLEKGALKNLGTAMGAAAALAVATPGQSNAPTDRPAHAQQQAQAPQAPQYSSREMLRTIAQVESSGGKQMDHHMLGGMHHGEKAYGKYGLTPSTIRDTIALNADLKAKHKKAMMLHGQDLHNYMQDNPELEDQVAGHHLQRLEHHFGGNPSAIGFAWLEGIRGTHRALKEHQPIDQHWHVKKISQVYGKGN